MPTAAAQTSSFAQALHAAGATGALIAVHDWSRTELGPISTWPETLRTALGMVLRAPVPMLLLWGVAGIMLYNDGYAAIAGARHPRILGGTVDDGWPELADWTSRTMKGGPTGSGRICKDQETVLVRDGRAERAWLDIACAPVLDEVGGVAGRFAIVADATARVLAERREAFLTELADAVRDLTDPAAIGMEAAGRLGRHLAASRVGCVEMHGNGPDAWAGAGPHWCAAGVAPVHGVWHAGRDAAVVMAELAAGCAVVVEDTAADPRVAGPSAAISAKRDIGACMLLPLLDAGALAAVLFVHSSEPRRWTQDEVALAHKAAGRMWSTARRARAETALRQGAASAPIMRPEALSDPDTLYRTYFDRSSEALFVVAVEPDGGFVIEQANQALLARTGLSADTLIGRRIEDAVPPETAARVTAHYRHAVETGEVQHYRETLELAGEPQQWDTVLVPLRGPDGRVARLIGCPRNVTRQVMAEEALWQARKMETIGQLTGGIAHDFNNLLGAVVGSLDLIRRRPDDAARVLRIAGQALAAAERGAKLTGQLLAFSRAQRLELKPLVVSDLVDGMRDLLARTMGPAIRTRFDFAAAGVPVLSDPTQLELAVLNLALNARDAMPQGGELVIRTRRRQIRDDPALVPGQYVELSVADTGTGMIPETLARAFDPFFTTKPTGRGSGLGLSQVYGLARQAGGAARIESRSGAGTTVRLFLRRTQDAPAAEQTAMDDEAADGRATATVLIVDDDPDVRRMLADALDTLGYRVAEAEDGTTGLAELDRAEPDLVVVDFAMPGMNGAEMARMARGRRPDLPIVFASGYADSAAIERAAGPKAPVLRKPFRVDELRAVLAGALDARPSVALRA